MLQDALDVFGIRVDFSLDIMIPNQDLFDITAGVLTEMRAVLDALRPDRVLVHGDTTTAMAAALAAFYARIPVAHVEAGLRTHDLSAPWPEELNRRVIDVIADLHFAPTDSAANNLISEGTRREKVVVTGNTVIDALLWARGKLSQSKVITQEFAEKFNFLDHDKRLILVTGHRRENFGEGIVAICDALMLLASRGDVEIIYPVHPNPNVQGPVGELLQGKRGVHLIAPVGYLEFVYLMGRSHLIITDSGGVQEEAPSLGKPVLVTRNITERPEAVEAGTVILVGFDTSTIVAAASELLDDPHAYEAMATISNPYGDGYAAERISASLLP